MPDALLGLVCLCEPQPLLLQTHPEGENDGNLRAVCRRLVRILSVFICESLLLPWASMTSPALKKGANNSRPRAAKD